MNNISKPQNITLGILYGVLGSLSFATMTVFVKLIGHSLPTSTVTFFRFVISLFFLLPWIINDPQFSFKIKDPLGYLIRVLASLSSVVCIFYVVKFIPLVDALLLNNTAPLFVPFVAWFMVKAKTPKAAWVGIFIGFVGVGVILQPGQEIFSWISSIALLSGLLAALAIVQIRLISKTSTTKQILFYYFFISTLVTGAFALLQWESPPNLKTWVFLFVIGILGSLYQLFSTLSYSVAPIRLMSSLFFLIVVFGGVFDWLIWNHIPTVPRVVGALLVITGAIITVYFGQKTIARSR